MDQENSKGQDKRNWRERLGIGAQGQKDLPKISDDFRKPAPVTAAPRPAASAAKPAPRPTATAVKPAPMAPRGAAKAATPPVAPDKLAERLRSQREASTKLAEQRVQIARQKAAEAPQAPAKPTITPQPPPAVSTGPKPKFSFAEEGAEQSKPAAPQVRSVGTPPPAIQPQLAPARPPLGGMVAPPPAPPPSSVAAQPPTMPQRPLTPPPFQPLPQQTGYMNGYQPAPVPPYRPVDPATGYAPPPGYMPQQRGYVPPAQQQFSPSQTGPRLNLPPRPDYGQRPAGVGPTLAPPNDFAAGVQPQAGFSVPPPRGGRPPLRGPALPAEEQGEYADEFYDEMPNTRGARPTRDDYQQAYREAEYGYENEETGSRTGLKLALALLLAVLLAGAGIWGYVRYVKPMMTPQVANQETPLVEPPQTPAKAEAEPKPVETPAAAAPSKKQIYDRIVGDQEVLGGDVTPALEQPAAIPEPSAVQPEQGAQPGATVPDDSAPLPIPPPPGGANGQQGALEPSTEKQSAETITPAAGESQAAVASADTGNPIADEQSVSRSIAPPPAPGEQVLEPSSPAAQAEAQQQETISDPDPAAEEKPVVAKKVAEKKVQKAKTAENKSLGAKPVVLVPPAKKAKAQKPKASDNVDQLASADNAASSSEGGLYGTTDGVEAGLETAPAKPAEAAKPKKKTLADLFRGSDDNAAPAPAPQPEQNVDVASIDPEPPAAPAAKKPAAPKAVEAASTGGGFVAQLASFRSRDEATREFARLKSKHGGVLGGFSPIITEATVGGSTRYRLSVGSMASKAQADTVCSSLISRGERDCLVKKF
jgi:hypothetical protein